MELNELEEREKNKSSLKFRITFFFVFFLAAVFAVFVITSVLQVNTVTQFICSHYALPTIEKAVKIIDTDSFEQLSKTLDASDPFYTETQQKLLEIKRESRCEYLYTMAQKKDSLFQYIIDGSDEAGGENFSEMGFAEDLSYWDKAALNAFSAGETRVGTIDRSEDYGDTISAYAPIFSKSGSVIGLIACDIDASEIVAWIKTQVIWQLGIVIVVIAIGLAVYLNLLRLVNRSFN